MLIFDTLCQEWASTKASVHCPRGGSPVSEGVEESFFLLTKLCNLLVSPPSELQIASYLLNTCLETGVGIQEQWLPAEW